MALIKCPECGREISDKASSCPNCGCPIQKKIKIEHNILKKGLKKKIKYRIRPRYVIYILISMILLAVGTVIIIKNNAYNNAIKEFETENYLEAYDYFKNSDYRQSPAYLQKTLEKYSNYLMNNDKFLEAELYINQITDKEIANKLSNESNYLHALYNYKIGAFEAAYNILKTIKSYKDAENIMDKASAMQSIQGEWLLYSDYKRKNVRGALKIVGWSATSYHSLDFDEVGNCKLKFENEDKFTLFKTNNKDGSNKLERNKPIFIFKTDNLEYQIAFQDGFLIIESYKDDYYRQLEKAYSPLTPWLFYDEYMCFEKSENNEITKQLTVPKIGMTADEVKQTNWGEPQKINKTTYSWGTSEQWCYSDYRYIYLEDGIVTSISE